MVALYPLPFLNGRGSPLEKRRKYLGRQRHGLSLAKQPGDASLKRLRGRLPQNGHMGDAIEENPVHRQVTWWAGRDGVLQPVVDMPSSPRGAEARCFSVAHGLVFLGWLSFRVFSFWHRQNCN